MMYQPNIPANKHLPVEKQHEITENLVYWCDKWQLRLTRNKKVYFKNVR